MEENNVKSFTTYLEMYELLTLLKTEAEQEKMALSIYKFMFEDIEPAFAKGSDLYKIWNNLSKPLVKSKEKSKATSKSNQNSNRNDNDIKMYMSMLMFNVNVNKLFKEYLEIRYKYKYVLSDSVVKRLIDKLNEFGKTDKDKEEILLKAINGKWKDFYRIETQDTTKETAKETQQEKAKREWKEMQAKNDIS